jgi:hypothetical protein
MDPKSLPKIQADDGMHPYSVYALLVKLFNIALKLHEVSVLSV